MDITEDLKNRRYCDKSTMQTSGGGGGIWLEIAHMSPFSRGAV